LFHYTEKAKAVEKILKDNCFKFSTYKDSNDPYEYRSKYIGIGGWNWLDDTENYGFQILNEVEKVFNENPAYLAYCMNRYSKGVLIHQGFLKSRMWSQYGENHSGVCLVFSKKKLIETIYKKFDSEDFLIYEGIVDYKDKLGKSYSAFQIQLDWPESANNSPYNITVSHIDKYHTALFFRKLKEYIDETEYRIVLLRTNEQANIELDFDITDSLMGIILGDQFPLVYKPAIEKLCASKNIYCRKLVWTNQIYTWANWQDPIQDLS